MKTVIILITGLLMPMISHAEHDPGHMKAAPSAMAEEGPVRPAKLMGAAMLKKGYMMHKLKKFVMLLKKHDLSDEQIHKVIVAKVDHKAEKLTAILKAAGIDDTKAAAIVTAVKAKMMKKIEKIKAKMKAMEANVAPEEAAQGPKAGAEPEEGARGPKAGAEPEEGAPGPKAGPEEEEAPPADGARE